MVTYAGPDAFLRAAGTRASLPALTEGSCGVSLAGEPGSFQDHQGSLPTYSRGPSAVCN